MTLGQMLDRYIIGDHIRERDYLPTRCEDCEWRTDDNECPYDWQCDEPDWDYDDDVWE